MPEARDVTLTLMYCVKIEKVLKKLEYETIAWPVIGVVDDLNSVPKIFHINVHYFWFGLQSLAKIIKHL